MSIIDRSLDFTLGQSLDSLHRAQRYVRDIRDLCVQKAELDLPVGPQDIAEIYGHMVVRMDILADLLSGLNTELETALENVKGPSAVDL